MHKNNEILELIWMAIKASVPAGEAILKVYGTEFSVDTKSDDSPLTRADTDAHMIITDHLEKTNIPILSEEGKDIPYEERKDWSLFWMVDPLDGTKEFVNRNGEFTVNIALIRDHYPVAGVIYIPVTDELFVGAPGMGTMKFSGVIHSLAEVSDIHAFIKKGTSLPERQSRELYTVVCSRSHMSAETEVFIEELKGKHGELDFASRGSSLKLCMVAEGKADIYPRFAPTMEWDTAAGQAIAENAGATVNNANTHTRLRYNKENLLNPWFIVKA
ncbi:MAG: 3'(2'),5'-bisphosphate nucleotidase CysQ [Bacteroidota bacterium]